MIGNQCCTHTRNLVGAHRGADTAAAQRHTSIHLTLSNSLSQEDYEIRVIVIRIESMRAKVGHLVAGTPQLLQQRQLQLEAPVISGDSDAPCLVHRSDSWSVR